jgi:lipopolysaccharide transport system ATP-binding protein
MSEPVIKVEALGKQYELRRQKAGGGYQTLRDSLTDTVSAWLRPTPPATADEFWALRDVSFSVDEGDVMGIIGRNGAGKSTLLKVLSRITQPTSGRARIRGRVASLLEVGTGFHPELSGRENIFLNGAILGMARGEIQAKFDEIVAFAEVERFLDTPVKRYSSGMYMRLAFAVAAHIEPEVLIVDEVLAVGDAEFQKKCLGRMAAVSRSGRTVLFVSHNINAIQTLCSRCVFLEQGRVVAAGDTASVVTKYLSSGAHADGAERCWDERATAPGFEGPVYLRAIRARGSAGEVRANFDVTEPIRIETEFEVLAERHCLNVHLYFYNEQGQTVLVAMDAVDSPFATRPAPPGRYRATCLLPGNLLNEGRLRVEYLITTLPSTGLHATVPDAICLTITDDRRPGGARGHWVREWPTAIVRPKLAWTVAPANTLDGI